ncbi:PucR family transcriptional regulator ligand-binding domain-containing protein [Microbispora sp. NPDC049125]|uniref:PucR family transcriptional regulator ligand-binding domain-containing protein n=1 Tax=Microbispora sp. NPDC049125 TaxID=3154929 RepID=UPI003466046A
MARLHLGVLAGREALDRPVRWVAVSELEDPTPFLEGGELVLTTGMRLTPRGAPSYVSRLVKRGAAGLGFGVGLGHDEVPSALVEAASAAGLPLLEVPRDTPFIAIGKAVSELLAAEQYEEISHAFAAQGRLTRAALQREGPGAVIDRLAREIGGWAVLLDDAGAVRHAAGVPGSPRHQGPAAGEDASQAALPTRPDTPDSHPESRSARRPESRTEGRPESRPEGRSETRSEGRPETRPEGRLEGRRAEGRTEGRLGGRTDSGDEGWAEDVARMLAPELARLRGAPGVSSLALATPGEHVVVQPLGRRGFFAAGTRRSFSPIGHTVVNAAGSLLTLALEQGREQRAAAAQVRAAVLRLLLAGEREAAAATMSALGGPPPPEPLTVLACQTSDAEALAEALPCFSAPWEGALVVLAPQDEAEAMVERAARHGRVGVGTPGAFLANGLDQARRALASAAPVARFSELAGQGLLSLLDPAAATSFAAALLAPLREYGSRADLVESLRAYLASNGHWDAAAQRLGVHRHTLRYRMKRVSELLGRDLDDPAARAELWIALSL